MIKTEQSSRLNSVLGKNLSSWTAFANLCKKYSGFERRKEVDLVGVLNWEG